MQNQMSDILSFADDLLESIAQVEGSSSSAVHECNFKDINLTSTSILLDECLSASSQGYSFTNTNTFRQTNPSKKDIKNNDDDNDIIMSRDTMVLNTSHSKQQKYELDPKRISLEIKGEEEDLYLNAAQRKIERDKLSQLKNKQQNKVTTIVKLDNLRTQSKEAKQQIDVSNYCERDQHHQIANRDNSGNHHELKDEDVNRLAYKCLDMFMKDVKGFCTNDCEESIKTNREYVKSFANVLEDKYLTLSLNLLPEGNETVSKVKTLITRFIAKCRKKDVSIEILRGLTALLDPKKTPSSHHKRANTWQCVLCLKKEISVKVQKCVNCGRPRGFRKKEYDKNIQKPTSIRSEERTFLAESDYTQKVKDAEQVVTVDEQKRRHYLYSKCDFEIESRLQLKSDVSELLESIRDFTM